MTTNSAGDDPDSGSWLLPGLKDKLSAFDAAGLRSLADAEMRKTFAHERAAAAVLTELDFVLNLLRPRRHSTGWSKQQAVALAMNATARAARMKARSGFSARARSKIVRKLEEIDALLD